MNGNLRKVILASAAILAVLLLILLLKNLFMVN